MAATAAANTNPWFVQPEVIDYDELLMDYDAQKQDNLTLTPPIIELDLDWMELDLPNVPGLEEKPFLTRALGGSFPGPTIAVSAGTTLRIRFNNKLEPQLESVKNSDNDIDDPDTANLHFHGGHVSSQSPGDDVSHVRVGPGESFSYELPIPDEHAPGTQWIHPHHHGSTSLHVGGGASLAFVVKDPPGYLPNQLDSAPEKIMVFQDFDMVKLEQMTKRANDNVLRGSLLEAIDATPDDGEKHRFVTINGKYRPTMELPKDEWQRWRIVLAGWRTNRLDFRFASPEVDENGNGAGCEFRLLAKDGIYISDFPRKVNSLPIAAGGRADVMVRCRGEPGKTTVFEAIGRAVLTVKTVSNDNVQDEKDGNGELAPWSPAALPEYLLDLSSTEATPGCSCETYFGGEGGKSLVNGLQYQSGHFLHTSFLGAVVERHLSFEGEHSYHQHMYPFQIVALDHGDNGENDGENSNGHEDENDDSEFEPFLRMGDWHDSYHGSEELKSATIRYKPTVLSGDLVLHCHNNIHSDRGMLAKEYIFPAGDNSECRCEVFGPVIVDKGDDGAGGESPDGVDGSEGSGDEDREDEADSIPDESSNSAEKLDDLLAQTQQQQPFSYSGTLSSRPLNRGGMTIVVAFSTAAGLLLGFFY